MKWIILDSKKNSFGELLVTFYNISTQEKFDSLFSEGEHYQAQKMIKFLNKKDKK